MPLAQARGDSGCAPWLGSCLRRRGSLCEAWSPTRSAALSLRTKFTLVCQNPSSFFEPPLLERIH